MNISLDYDDTYTRDPVLFNTVIRLMSSRGHKVYCVTMRTPEEGAEVHANLSGLVHGIIFTSRKAKKEFCFNMGININVWIDDSPFFVLQDAAS